MIIEQRKRAMKMDKLYDLIKEMRKYVDKPEDGLPEELFLFATEITPMVNVDLLVKDDRGRILLSWRNDKFYGAGWYVPGGILRLKETLEDRVRKVAENEIFCKNIYFNQVPIDVVSIICPEMKQRGHFISFIYECKLPEEFELHNRKQKGEAGYLQWFDACPDNILKVHEFYRKYWNNL